MLEVYEQTRRAAATCREGKGPVLLEAVTWRHGGHHINDPGLYMPRERVEFYRARDPLDIGRRYLAEIGGASDAEIQAVEAAVDGELKAAVDWAKASPELSREEFMELVEAY